MIFMGRSIASIVRLAIVLAFVGTSVSGESSALQPPSADYCEMLERDIQGEHYGFVAGNKLYYVAGAFGAYWDQYQESETLGFTHPLFRDGRARGHAIINADGGRGHDSWGWEFWRKTRSAYGALIVNGREHGSPRPKTLDWRPDKMIANYEVGGVRIREEKFISLDDVLTTVIVADRDVEIRFEGESFWNNSRVPTFDGDNIGGTISRSCESKITFDRSANAMRLLEAGTAIVKPIYEKPAGIGRMMYDGLSFVYSASAPMEDFRQWRQGKGNLGYSFRLKLRAGQPVALTLAVADDYNDALERTRKGSMEAASAMAAKTEWFNDLLNEQIPYFRCSDEMTVKTYYYLWALNFMYFRDVGEGWLQYPHTQTAVNNFMGLHLWDSWAYIQAGSWVADKWKWGFGNTLSWQYMTPFKNRHNRMPDNFGKEWYSPIVRASFVGATEPAWQQYRRSGDKRYLQEAYDKVFKPLYWDGNGPTQSFGTEINAVDALSEMAKTLGKTNDVRHWQSFRSGMVRRFRSQWSGRWEGFYGGPGVPWKDIWALSTLQSAAMPKEWGKQMVEEYVLDTDKGFASPVGVNTRAADSPPNGIFRCSTISSWLAIDGMFRQDQAYAGILTTLNHTKAMHREWGYPVAPEAWEENHKAWGSRYYNWDLAHVLPLIEWLAGLDYNIPEQTFTFAPHLPNTWDYIETYVPVVVDGSTNWVHSRVERRGKGDQVRLVAGVRGNPLTKTLVAPYTEDREVLKARGNGRQVDRSKAVAFESKKSSASVTVDRSKGDAFESKKWGASVAVDLGPKQTSYKTLVWATPRSRIFHRSVEVEIENLIPGTIIRYTTNGREPTERSPVWDGAVRINSTTTFKLRAYGDDGSKYEPYEMVYTATDLKPARSIAGKAEPGMFYRFYELGGRQTKLPDFDALKPTRTEALAKHQFDRGIKVAEVAGGRGDHYALRLTSYLKVPVDEVYHFHLQSDDGARLVIDGQVVINLDTHSYLDPWEAEGSIGLKQGLHQVDLYYYQDRRRARLTVKSRKGNEPQYQDIPADSWRMPAP